MSLMKCTSMTNFDLPLFDMYVTCNTLDQRTWSPEDGNSWAVLSDWIRLTSRQAIPEMPRGISEIPRRVRETENRNWSFLLK